MAPCTYGTNLDVTFDSEALEVRPSEIAPASPRRAYVRLIACVCGSAPLVCGAVAMREMGGHGGLRSSQAASVLSSSNATQLLQTLQLSVTKNDFDKWYNLSASETKLACNLGYNVISECLSSVAFDDVTDFVACEVHAWEAYDGYCDGVEWNATTKMTESPNRRLAETEERRRLHGDGRAYVCSELSTGFGTCLDRTKTLLGLNCGDWSDAIYETLCIDGVTEKTAIFGNH